MKSELSVYRDKDGSCSIWRGEKALAGGLSDKDAMEMAAGPELLWAVRLLLPLLADEYDAGTREDEIGEPFRVACAAMRKATGRHGEIVATQDFEGRS
jgi:hypothetical protein